jgi:hypothetical protein
MTPGLFGQPGAYNGSAQFGHESGQAGLTHQSAFGGQPNAAAQNPFTQNQFSPSPFATHPYQQGPWSQNQQGPWSQSPVAHNPFQSSFAGPAGVNIPAQQIVPVLAQLAQQIAVQAAVAQQIGLAVHQLAHQLAAQANSFSNSPQVGYGGFNPQQAQAWGAGRQQTIQ